MLDAVRVRRSIRRYGQAPVSESDMAQLQEAALRAPSSRNLQPWQFVFVTDPELLAGLSEAKTSFGQFLAGAPLGVVVCGDESVSDCWIEDCSIAATILQLTATDLGLGSCWIQIRGRLHAQGQPAEQYVRELLHLPDNLRVLTILAVGHPAESKEPKPDSGLTWDRIITR